MDLREAMSTARSIRRFEDREVEQSVLLRCLEAATWAPSGGNKQGWRFIILRSPEARRAMQEAAQRSLRLVQEIYGMQRPKPSEKSRRAREARAVFQLHDHAAEVPAAVLFTYLPQPLTPQILQGASIFPAMQNFLLAARAEGLGAVVTGWATAGEDILRSAVGIPQTASLAALVVAGWPVGRHGPVRRAPLSSVVSFDQWGWSEP